jgi:hypothetical protein
MQCANVPLPFVLLLLSLPLLEVAEGRKQEQIPYLPKHIYK